MSAARPRLGRHGRRELLRTLCTTIDERRWDHLRPLLHDDFVCRYVHTGEVLDADTWIRTNAEYPDFDRMVLEDLVGHRDRAVSRCHVTGRSGGETAAFEVASFATVASGQITKLTEVWADVGLTPPEGTRPA